jgi:hypothetical protein
MIALGTGRSRIRNGRIEFGIGEKRRTEELEQEDELVER